MSETANGIWVPLDRLGDYALPNLMKKVVAFATKGVGCAASEAQAGLDRP